jgi:hypothetical protein
VKEVTVVLGELRSSFDLTNPQIGSVWSQYLSRVDDAIEDSLRKSLRTTMQAIRSYLTKGIGAPSSGIGSGAESIVVLEAAFCAEEERVRKEIKEKKRKEMKSKKRKETKRKKEEKNIKRKVLTVLTALRSNWKYSTKNLSLKRNTWTRDREMFKFSCLPIS